MRRLFKGSVYCKIITLKVKSYFLLKLAKFSALTTELCHVCIAKILKRELDGRAAKYGHFELRNIVIQENKFPRNVYITELYPTCFYLIILSNKRRILLISCGVYSRAACIGNFVSGICGV